MGVSLMVPLCLSPCGGGALCKKLAHPRPDSTRMGGWGTLPTDVETGRLRAGRGPAIPRPPERADHRELARVRHLSALYGGSPEARAPDLRRQRAADRGSGDAQGAAGERE